MIHAVLAETAAGLGAEVDCRQSNHEGTLIDWIGAAADDRFDGILINPGALTHTSYALHDALKGVAIPAVEVHVSNPDAREAFRRRSRVAPACLARVAGFGGDSYALALQGLLTHLARASRSAEVTRRAAGANRDSRPFAVVRAIATGYVRGPKRGARGPRWRSRSSSSRGCSRR